MSDEQPDPGDGQDATTWVPQPLPPDAELGPVGDVDALDLLADDFGPKPSVAVDLGEVPEEPDDDAEPGAGGADDAEPGKAAEPDEGQTPQPAVSADPVLSDPRVPTEEEMLRVLSGGRRRVEKPERDWRGVVIATVVTLFTVFAPVQIITGGGVLLLVVFVVGGALVVIGCPTVIRSLSTTGTMRLGPLVSVAAGVIIMVACAVMMVAGADGASSLTEDGAVGQALANYSAWQPEQ